jgi:predicted CoA-binding protein
MTDLTDPANGRRNGLAVCFATLLALHGVAQFVGTTATLRMIDDGRPANLLDGLWVVSSAGWLRLIAAGWAALGVATLAAAALVWIRSRHARTVVAAAALASLVFSIVGLWAALIGVMLNAGLLAIARRNPPTVFAGAPRPITALDSGAVDRFLTQRRVVLIGASADPRKFGNTIFRALRDHGYDVVPVNLTASSIDGTSCFRRVTEVDGEIGAAMIMVTGRPAVRAVRDCVARGIRRVWLFRGIGSPGALSEEAVKICHDNGIDVVAGACPLMFLEPIAPLHNVHLALLRFSGTLTEADSLHPVVTA